MDESCIEDVEEWFSDEANRGIASGTELSRLIGVDEQRLRAEGRARDLRRVGAAYVWSRDDVDELLRDLEEEAEEEEEDELDEEE